MTTDEQLAKLTEAVLLLAATIETVAASLKTSTRNAASASINTGGITPKSTIKVTAPKQRAAIKTTLTLRGKK